MKKRLKINLIILVGFIFSFTLISANFGYNSDYNPIITDTDLFLKNDGDSGIGTYNFNGNWIDGGVSIIDGNIYAQTGYFYNITSLNITQANLTINDNMFIQGKLGIGTTSPTYNVDINSSNEIILNVESIDNRAGIRIADDDTTSYLLSEASRTSIGQTNSVNAANLNIDSSGHLGVGSTIISGDIHIMETDIDADIDNVYPTMIFGQQSGTYTAGTYYGNLRWARPNSNGGTAVAGIAARTLSVTTADLIFYTQQGADNVHLERMTIAGTGNVGIGNTAPNSRLEVNGTFNASTEGGSLRVDSNGNVKIGI